MDPYSKIIIFGSFAVKQFTAESDLDIAVIIPDHWGQKEFLERLYNGTPLSNWPLDLLVFRESYYNHKKEIGGVCFDINDSGIELYPNWSINESYWKKI